MILEQLGSLPLMCLPLYLLTVHPPHDVEQVVYVGKTSSKTKRFSGGHVAISKLHDPKFANAEKWLYLASVMLLDENDGYLPLEEIGPMSLATEVLASVEAQLIYDLQPQLNTQGRSRCLAKRPLSSIQVQNFCSDMLKFQMIFGAAK